MTEFKRGDVVRAKVKIDNRIEKGTLGVVRSESYIEIGVDFFGNIDGHDINCDNEVPDSTGWFVGKNDLELVKDRIVEKAGLRVGDRICFTKKVKDYNVTVGCKGTIVAFTCMEGFVGIRFDKECKKGIFNLHTLGGILSNNAGLWIKLEDVKECAKVEIPIIEVEPKIIMEEPKTEPKKVLLYTDCEQKAINKIRKLFNNV